MNKHREKRPKKAKGEKPKENTIDEGWEIPVSLQLQEKQCCDGVVSTTKAPDRGIGLVSQIKLEGVPRSYERGMAKIPRGADLHYSSSCSHP